jgi:very-short-patch-repair endonuclease
MAAVLACGEGAVLSHRSAAALHGLRPDSRQVTDVSVAARRKDRNATDIRVHSSSTLLPRDITTVDGIPCTSVARTLLDLAAETTRQSLNKAIKRAETLELFDANDINELLNRSSGLRGAAKLRRSVAAYNEPRTRSEFESRVLELCKRHKIPTPETNQLLTVEDTTIEIDFLWPDAKIALEADGFAFHRDRQSFARDRRRDQLLSRNGWRPVRATWEQLDDELARTVRALIAQPAVYAWTAAV